jgi:hypothetical protein
MPSNLLKPVMALNAVFVLLLITLGPRYGWNLMIAIGALVSVVNILAVRAAGKPPRP